MKINRFVIYFILLFLLVLYILFNKNNPSNSLYLTDKKYKLLVIEAENNNTNALRRLYQYHRFYIRDNNKTIIFLQKYQKLENAFIHHTLAIHLLNSKVERIGDDNTTSHYPQNNNK
jgi:hypothetical protein